MSKSQPIQLSIPSPCSQNWQEMTATEKGRYCAHCRKEVTDFTQWSDAALYDYFKNKKENTCGRFHAHQLNRPINIPPQPHSRLYKIVVALGLTVLAAGAEAAHAQTARPLTAEYITGKETISVPDTTGPHSSVLVSGKVIDNTKEAVIGARVSIEVNGKIIESTATDYDGFFKIIGSDTLLPASFDVIVQYPGMKTSKTIGVAVGDVLNLETQWDEAKYLETGLIINYAPPLIDKRDPLSTTIRSEQINHLPY